MNGSVDWSTLTPRQIFDALESAPKVAGPWQGTNAAPYNQRYTTVRLSGALTYDGHFATRCSNESERAAADAALREDGWILVDDTEPAPPEPSDHSGIGLVSAEAWAVELRCEKSWTKQRDVICRVQANARNAALEEAALVCADEAKNHRGLAIDCADSIRKLKTPEST